MIRAFNHLTFLKSSVRKGKQITSQAFFFSNSSNNENNSNNQNDQHDKNNMNNQPKKQKGFLFGYKYDLLYHAMRRNLYYKMKANYLEKKKFLDESTLKAKATTDQETGKKQEKQSKQKQKEGDQKKPLDEKQAMGHLKKFLWMGLVFMLLSQFGNQGGSKKKDQRKNIDFVLQQIRSSPEPCKVSIQNHRFLQLQMICQVGRAKKYAMKISQNQLVLFLQELEKIRDGSTEVTFSSSNYRVDHLAPILHKLLVVGLFIGVSFFGYKTFKAFQQTAGSMDISKIFNSKKFQPVKPENINIFFKDVAGMHEAKFEITQFVDFLKKPDKYIEMGAKVPKGALLTGPPGTGKTLLAKACAGQAGVPFFSVSGSDFVQRFSGLGASRVRSLFDEAQKNAPSIIFIDEIDAIGKKRDAGPFSNEQRDNTLNQLLVRMDGFDTKQKVIVMAATNRKDMLDPALLRPGRFDRSVQIGLPSFAQRVQILKVHLKKVKYDTALTQDDLAKKIGRLTPGFSGAQLANTCNEAAIMAARQNLPLVALKNFQKATQRVMAGLQKRNLFSEQQKQILAFYEAGKAVANWFTQGADPVIKISILPFSKSKAGYSHSIRDQTALNTKQQLLAKVCCYLAGRSSEQHFKGYVSTNGNNDLERAKKIITMIVTKFGMSQALKMFAFPDFDFIRKPYSEKTQAIIDQQIAKLTQQCQKKVQAIIKSKQQQIIKLKEKLIQKQTLTHNQIKQVLGDRPFAQSQTYQQYLKDQKQEQTPKGPQEPRAGVAAG